MLQMKIIPLSQGTFSVDKKKIFHPINEKNAEQGLIMEVRPFVAVTARDVVLLDVGLSQEDAPKITERLEQNGIQPSQVTKILLSHLHKDHVGGLGDLEGHFFQENFPHATIYLQKREYDFATSEAENPSFDVPMLLQIGKLSNLHWLNDDEGEIAKGIFYKVTKGHTPFHQVFWLKDEYETVFFGADDLPRQSYVRTSIAYKTDFNGKTARDFRQEWLEKARAQNWKVLLFHDEKRPFLELEK